MRYVHIGPRATRSMADVDALARAREARSAIIPIMHLRSCSSYAGSDECSSDIRSTEIQHALFLTTTQGKLFLAPLGNHIQHALDIATGK